MAEDKIIEKLIELDQKIDNTVRKEEFTRFRDEVLTSQDKMITILQRLDEERVFGNQWVKGIEEKVEKNSREIIDINLRLKTV